MKRLPVHSLVVLTLLLTGCISKDNEQPNIVFILVDDLGWRDLGFMGSTYYETPNIDALVAEGMSFQHAYANAPNCAPTRAALMSGQYAPRHGVYTVGSPERGEARFRQLVPTPNTTTLDTTVVTMAESLKALGYDTAHLGKWHLGGGVHSPQQQGFDVADEGSWGEKRSHFMPGTGVYLADYLTDRAIEFISQPRSTPFFLYLSHYGVHTPIESRPEKVEVYETKEGDEHHFDPTYAGMIESIDESVGRVIEALDTQGLTENTVVVFFSDNGGYGPITKMWPLRGAKGMLYEGGIRVPLAVRWPGRVLPGRTSLTPVIGVDLYPTFLDVAGGGVSEGHFLDGMSLVPELTGSVALERDAIYWHFPAYLEAYRDSEVPWRTTPAGAIRSGSYKLIEFFGEERLELYDLSQDVGEVENLVNELPAVADSLHRMLITWRKRVDAPVPETPNPAFEPTAFEEANGLFDPYRP